MKWRSYSNNVYSHVNTEVIYEKLKILSAYSQMLFLLQTAINTLNYKCID